jgi:phage/plasmid-like protein (TIGR03299 family)
MNIQEQMSVLEARTALIESTGATRTDAGTYVASSGWDANEVVGRDGLATQNDQISLWLNGEPAWHKLGQVSQGWTSIDQVLTDSGLNWQVETRPMFWGAGPEAFGGLDKVTVGQMFATVRVDPDGAETQLGTVGRVYNPFQNHEAFAFLQDIAEQDENTFSSAGMLSKGSLVFVTMELGQDLIIDPEGVADAVKRYLTFTNRHDGKGKIRVHVSPTRVVCTNTLDWSIEGATSSWEALHTKGSRDKVEQARQDLHLANAYYEQFAEDATTLFQSGMTETEFDEFIRSFYPLDTDAPKGVQSRVQAQQDGVREIWEAAPTMEGIRGTRWGAAQAVTEFVDHHGAVRVPKSLRIDTALDQTVREQMARGARLIGELDSDEKSRVHRALLTWKN